MQLVDKKSQVHLYLQVADSIRERIASGEYPVGSILPIESELCEAYGVSRYPLRQAMAILVKEGYLQRSRGKGTYVTHPKTQEQEVQTENTAARPQLLALILPALADDFAMDMLKGFERAAAGQGYATIFAVSGKPEAEIDCIERAVRCGAAGIIVFPDNETLINEELLNELLREGIYVSILDRNPGLDHLDYIGSDNNGGGYLAARHMKLNGYTRAVFVSDMPYLSSVQERLSGFRRGLRQYDVDLLNDTLQEDTSKEPDYSLEKFKTNLPALLEHLPFAVFGENYFTAYRAIKLLQEQGIAVGDEVGVIGFDNLPQSKYINPPMTTIVQNGELIGETAASLAIQKIESGSKQSIRHILPTQLIARKSCGEDRSRQ